MPASELPSFFMPLFAATFVVNLAYVASVFLLRNRLASPAIKAAGYEAPRLVGGSPVDLVRLFGFLLSGRHKEFADPMVTRLVWVVRVLFPIGAVMTASIFAIVLGASS
jgi:hypothetical protein